VNEDGHYDPESAPYSDEVGDEDPGLDVPYDPNPADQKLALPLGHKLHNLEMTISPDVNAPDQPVGQVWLKVVPNQILDPNFTGPAGSIALWWVRSLEEGGHKKLTYKENGADVVGAIFRDDMPGSKLSLFSKMCRSIYVQGVSPGTVTLALELYLKGQGLIHTDYLRVSVSPTSEYFVYRETGPNETTTLLSRAAIRGSHLRVSMNAGPDYYLKKWGEQGFGNFLQQMQGTSHADKDSAQVVVWWGPRNAQSGKDNIHGVSGDRSRTQVANWDAIPGRENDEAFWDTEIPEGVTQLRVIVVYTDIKFGPVDKPAIVGYWHAAKQPNGWTWATHQGDVGGSDMETINGFLGAPPASNYQLRKRTLIDPDSGYDIWYVPQP